MVSDNVFVGSVYITEVAAALKEGAITRDEFDMLALAINTRTNLPSVARPNGQAAFLFLLTSAIAPHYFAYPMAEWFTWHYHIR